MDPSIESDYLKAEVARDKKFVDNCFEFMKTIMPVKQNHNIEPEEENTTAVVETEPIPKKRKYTRATVNVFKLNYKIGLCIVSMVYDVVIVTL